MVRSNVRPDAEATLPIYRGGNTGHMMTLRSVKTGFDLSVEDQRLVNTQKALTQQINRQFIQVGAIFLSPASRAPVDDSWYERLPKDTDLQSWIDDDGLRSLNVGFNLQFGWMDLDIDAEDPEFNRLVASALRFAGLDCRFGFGRVSVGAPTHYLMQLSEDQAKNFEKLWDFAPRAFNLGGKKYHVEFRSFPANLDAKNLIAKAKQVVVPGSVYTADKPGKDYDISVWYSGDGPAGNVRSIAETTPKQVDFTSVVRAVAFASVAYVLRENWVEGSRQHTANRFTGWLARVVSESQGINNHEALAKDVFCPIDGDDIAERLIRFMCRAFGDDEEHMRLRTYYDARDKLSRNPDAKIPGWHSMTEMLGAEAVQALRVIAIPGNEVSKLTDMVERYVYDETDNKYIDRKRHLAYGNFVHDGSDLERRHKGDVIFIGGKPREAFKVFESSSLRTRVGFRDLYPDLDPGAIYRVDAMANVVPDEDDAGAQIVYNTWKGWPIAPIDDHGLDEALMSQCVAMLDKLLALLTRDNVEQMEWAKKWIAWTFQHPGKKQQIAWVVIGDQGVGKSFFGNVFMRALLTDRLWGAASPKILDQAFTIGPFKDKMFVFIDEADFTRNAGAADEIKKLIRNVDISGMEKFEEARGFRIFARLMFAGNKLQSGISQRDVRDRALFYTLAYDASYKGLSELEFREWAETLKPFFDEFGELLRSRNAVAHFIRYFMDLPCGRHEVESIRVSSTNDPTIVESNSSWLRRIIKHIIESGWLSEENSSWETPFTPDQFSARVAVECRTQGLPGIRPDHVYKEFEAIGLLRSYNEHVKGASVRFTRPLHRWADSCRQFEKHTGFKLVPYREFEVGRDFGINEETTQSRVNRIGPRPSVTAIGGASGKF